jgi:PhzF family phenazine biosynthesis protein
MDFKGERKLTIRGLDVFTDRPFSGNPTTVVLNADGLRDGDMQAVARELNLETTFVLQTTVAGADFQLRYFMPLREIELCGHGTIGAIWALAEEGLLQRGVSSVVVETPVGSLKVALEWEGKGVRNVVMDQLAPEFSAPRCSVEEVAQALGLAPREIATERFPLMCASTGRAKLLIPIRTWEPLDRITVDERALIELCQRLDVTGLYPFTLKPRNPSATAEARQFPYGGGVPEDPVTGVAACALGAYLVHQGVVQTEEPVAQLVVEQGHAIGRPGRVEVRVHVENGEIVGTAIAGRAVTVSRAEMQVLPTKSA